MTTTVQHKRSETTGAEPASGDILVGEIAVNLTDGKLFSKKTDGTVVTLAGNLTATTYYIPTSLGYITEAADFGTDFGLVTQTVSNGNTQDTNTNDNVTFNTVTTTAGVTVGGELTVTGTAWTSYTPTWSSSGTSPSIGNGTITGKYKKIGKTVFVKVRIQLGSTSTTGTGNWRISLPVNAADNLVVMPSTYLDNGVAWHTGVVNCEYDGQTSYVVPLKGTSPSGAVDATSPFTWNSGDSLTFNGSYECV